MVLSNFKPIQQHDACIVISRDGDRLAILHYFNLDVDISLLLSMIRLTIKNELEERDKFARDSQNFGQCLINFQIIIQSLLVVILKVRETMLLLS